MGGERDNWICHCGNENYGFRVVCNKNNCRAPKPQMWRQGPNKRSMFLNRNEGGLGEMNSGYWGGQDWQCHNCGNLNWASHMVCSTTGCKAKHPQVEMNNGPRTWVCKRCSNANYLNREVCNKRDCDEPRPENIKLSSRVLPSGEWECCKCGNLNYAMRTVCNRKTCDNPAPRKKNFFKGPWICRDCNNLNYAEREVCNIKSCGKPRPDDGGEKPAVELPSGEWVCPKCKNINYSIRTVCNNRSCSWVNPAKKKPREWVCSECNNVNWEHRTVCNMSECEGRRPERDLKNGDWECSCGNLNFNHREVCNMSSCDEVRPEWATELAVKFKEAKKRSLSEDEDARESKRKKLEDAPEGSWICPTCTNLNWPLREVCNNRKCDTKRPPPKFEGDKGDTM